MCSAWKVLYCFANSFRTKSKTSIGFAREREILFLFIELLNDVFSAVRSSSSDKVLWGKWKTFVRLFSQFSINELV
jgi:hypothetical protein